jgi:CRISPR-associated protein Cmx8
MDESLKLAYDLYSLPTAQHRAGLAGLLVVIETMRRRGRSNLPGVEGPAGGVVRLTLTERSLIALFNEIYEATTEETSSRKVFTDRRTGEPVPPIRQETVTFLDPKTGKERTRTEYVYPQVVPGAPFLQALDMPPIWLKLWRDAVWQTLRGVPLTRKPYEERADGRDVHEATTLWQELLKEQRQAAKGETFVTEVASSLLLGAQAVNAERVPFRGRPSENLLLHGWPVVMGLGEAWRVKAEKGGVTEEAEGYVLTVPNVADIDAFVDEFMAGVAQLSEDRFRYRPREAVLALPAEGGLEYLRHLALLAKALSGQGNIAFTVSGVEVYHLAKRGNSVVTLATDHVPARPDLLDRYELVRGHSFNLLFRAQLLRNLLADRPWYAGFGRLFDTQDQDLFFDDGFGSFRADARRKFAAEASVGTS